MKTLLPVGACARLSVVCGLLLSLPAIAQTGAPVQFDPVIVTATGNPTPLAETLAPLLVLTREDIARAQATDLAELLRFYAGVEIGRNGGAGATTSVFVRGGESNHTLILIDGVRVNPATSGGAALQNIAPDAIERIEIVKGPRASLYGSDAIAGVINVITRGSGQTGVDASLRGGSENTYDGSLRGAYAGERGGVSLQAQHFKTDGFPALIAQTKDTGYDRTSVNADANLKLGKATVGARLWDASGETDYYGFDPVDFSRVVVSQKYRNQVAAVDAAVPFSDALSATLRASHMKDDIEQQQSEDFVETVRNGVDAALVWSGGAQRITGGASLIREEVDALSFGSPIDEDRDIVILRAQDEVNAGRHHAVLGATWSDYDGFGDRYDGNLDYGFDLTTSGRLVASAGTGFRAPDATDRFGFGGNPDLKPEKARNYELGWQQRFATAQRLDLRIFRSDVEDLISVTFDEDFNPSAVNVDRYRNEGVELTYGLKLDQWSATLTGLLQDPQDRSTDSQLLRRSKRSIAARLNRDFGIWNAGIDVLGSGPRPDFGGVELGGYTLVDLTGGVRLGERTQLRLRVENLFDKDYQTASGFRQQGAAGYLTLSYGL